MTQKLARRCKKCYARFIPGGKYCRLCEKCNAERMKLAWVKRMGK